MIADGLGFGGLVSWLYVHTLIINLHEFLMMLLLATVWPLDFHLLLMMQYTGDIYYFPAQIWARTRTDTFFYCLQPFLCIAQCIVT